MENINWHDFLVGAEKLEFKKVDVKKGDIFLSKNRGDAPVTYGSIKNSTSQWDNGCGFTVRRADGDDSAFATNLAGDRNGWTSSRVCMIRFANGEWAPGFGPKGRIATPPTPARYEGPIQKGIEFSIEDRGIGDPSLRRIVVSANDRGVHYELLNPGPLADRFHDMSVEKFRFKCKPVRPTTKDGWKAFIPEKQIPAQPVPRKFKPGQVIAIYTQYGYASVVEIVSVDGSWVNYRDLITGSSYGGNSFSDRSATASDSVVVFEPEEKVLTVDTLAGVTSKYVPSETYDGPICRGAKFQRRSALRGDGDAGTITIQFFSRRAAKVEYTTSDGVYKTTSVKRFRRVFTPVFPKSVNEWVTFYPTGSHRQENPPEYPVGTIVGIRKGPTDIYPGVYEITGSNANTFSVKVLAGRLGTCIIKQSEAHRYCVVIFEASSNPKKPEVKVPAPAVAPPAPVTKLVPMCISCMNASNLQCEGDHWGQEKECSKCEKKTYCETDVPVADDKPAPISQDKVPEEFRIVGRSGPGVPLPYGDQWVRFARWSGSLEDATNDPPRLWRQKDDSYSQGYWREGCFDILEKVDETPGTDSVLAKHSKVLFPAPVTEAPKVPEKFPGFRVVGKTGASIEPKIGMWVGLEGNAKTPPMTMQIDTVFLMMMTGLLLARLPWDAGTIFILEKVDEKPAKVECPGYPDYWIIGKSGKDVRPNDDQRVRFARWSSGVTIPVSASDRGDAPVTYGSIKNSTSQWDKGCFDILEKKQA